MAYQKTNWEDLPSTDTPIMSANLQNIEDGVENLDLNVTELINDVDAIDLIVSDITNDSGWQTIVPTQGAVGTGYYVPCYRKIGKYVFLKGLINNVTTRASEIFTLPSGFYNSTNRFTFCTTNDNLEINFVRVTNNGVVQIQQSSGNFNNGVNLILDGIFFLID